MYSYIGSCIRAVLTSLIALNRFSFNLENLLYGILRTRVCGFSRKTLTDCVRFPWREFIVCRLRDVFASDRRKRACVLRDAVSFRVHQDLRWKSLKPLFVWLALCPQTVVVVIKVIGLSNIHYYVLIESYSLYSEAKWDYENARVGKLIMYNIASRCRYFISNCIRL
jgi:hypothetical protein